MRLYTYISLLWLVIPIFANPLPADTTGGTQVADSAGAVPGPYKGGSAYINVSKKHSFLWGKPSANSITRIFKMPKDCAAFLCRPDAKGKVWTVPFYNLAEAEAAKKNVDPKDLKTYILEVGGKDPEENKTKTPLP